MSLLADDMAEDLDAVFLDLEEFSSKHEVNGKDIPVIFDDEKLKKINEKSSLGFRDDVHQAELFFYATEKDLGSRIRANELMTVDGQEKFVHSANLTGGMWSIVLGRRRL